MILWEWGAPDKSIFSSCGYNGISIKKYKLLSYLLERIRQQFRKVTYSCFRNYVYLLQIELFIIMELREISRSTIHKQNELTGIQQVKNRSQKIEIFCQLLHCFISLCSVNTIKVLDAAVQGYSQSSCSLKFPKGHLTQRLFQ